MNSTNKQHRHPGLWSLPGLTTLENISQRLLGQQPTGTPGTSSAPGLSAHSPQVAEVAAALKLCAANNEMAGRWVTIIGEPESLSCNELTQLIMHCAVPAHRVRWLRPNDNESKAWAAEQALLLDNSALIIAWLGQCQSRDALRLQLARRHTQANTLLYSKPLEKTPLH